MLPQSLGTWPWGRQTLAIGTHNLTPNNGKSNLFSQYWSKNKAKKNRPQDFYDTGHSRYVDFAYLDTTTYVEVIFHSQNFFSIFLCISTPSMSKTVNMKQRVSRGDFSCPRRIFYYICYCIHVIFSWAQIGRSAIFGREIGVPDREIFSRQKIFQFNVKTCLFASP